ncbi:MAG: hypothetical protein MR779_00980 [Tenericutes bacterium]|nr:hypothetical protein [Mycoplasmatota bacterium]
MKYFIDFQGTCWLVQYLNLIKKDYDKNTFYKYLALNRFIRYKKAINLVKKKSLLNDKDYLFLTLLNFDGSYFDIEDINNYDIVGKVKEDINDRYILLNNEKTIMLLLKMYDEDIDLEEEIMFNLFLTFGKLEFKKRTFNDNFKFITFNDNLGNCKYILSNSENIYDERKTIINTLVSPVNLIDKALENDEQILISLDLGKSIYFNNILKYPNEIKLETLEKFLGIDNHYYIIVGKKEIDGKKYYDAFSGYNDENMYCLIEEKYINLYVNHIIYDKIIYSEEKTLDFYKFIEGEL